MALEYLPGNLKDADAGEACCDALRAVMDEAPLFTPTMPRSGKPMSVRMTNCGPLGWVTDKERGYRYQADASGDRQALAGDAEAAARSLAGGRGLPAPPGGLPRQLLRGDAKMGLHQDKDEEDFAAPVVSVSLGDTAIFRVGGLTPQRPDADASSLSQAMSSCLAAMTGLLFTASTASCPEPRLSCLRAAASI